MGSTGAQDDGGLVDRLTALIGQSFSKEVTFSLDDIKHFATLVGDTNPAHHDSAGAAAASFDTIVASGTHTLSVMLAVVPDHFRSLGPNVGLGASVRMLKPVRAKDRARVDWTVSNVTRSAKLRGWVLELQGKLTRQDGVLAMKAETEVLFRSPSASTPN